MNLRMRAGTQATNNGKGESDGHVGVCQVCQDKNSEYWDEVMMTLRMGVRPMTIQD